MTIYSIFTKTIRTGCKRQYKSKRAAKLQPLGRGGILISNGSQFTSGQRPGARLRVIPATVCVQGEAPLSTVFSHSQPGGCDNAFWLWPLFQTLLRSLDTLPSLPALNAGQDK